MGHDDVGVAFHDQRGVRFANRFAGQVQTVEQVALGIERRFGRVDILGAGRLLGRPFIGQPGSTRPPAPTARPWASKIGNISRPRNQS